MSAVPVSWTSQCAMVHTLAPSVVTPAMAYGTAHTTDLSKVLYILMTPFPSVIYYCPSLIWFMTSPMVLQLAIPLPWLLCSFCPTSLWQIYS